MMHLTKAMIRYLWITGGFVLVGIGIIGSFTPLMPSLVFFLGATYCFARSSRKFLRMIVSNKHVGQQILDFKKGRGMTVGTKIRAITVMLTSMFVSAFFLVKIVWVKWAICFTALGVTTLILAWKTKNE